jgi:hypothetical protein
MRQVVFLLLGMMGLSCHRRTESMESVAPYEYEVYRVIMSHLDDSSLYVVVAVTDSTLSTDPVTEKSGVVHGIPPGSYTPREFKKFAFVWPEFQSQRFQSFFETTNLRSYQLAIESLRVSDRVRKREWRIMDSSPDSGLFSQGKLLLVSFSRVAIDSSGSEALLYTERVCGHLCGEGRWFWLKRSGNSWVIYKSLPSWQS